jgi:hypothetical protein
MSNSLLKLKEFDSSNLVCSAPKALNAMGAKSVNLNYKFNDGQSPITFQTPWMRSFGINQWVDPKNANAEPKLSVTLSFMGSEENESVTAFKEFLESIDEWAIDTAHKNAWEWLKTKSAPRDTIAFNYTRSLKVPVDQATGEPNGKPANMKLKLNKRDGGFDTSFFNTDKQVIPADEVDGFFNKGSKVRALVQCTGFWIAAGKFGLSWKLKQMIIEPSARIGKAYAFNDDEEEESAPVQKKAAPAVAPKKVEAQVVEEEEEEEAPEEKEAPAAEPEPTQAKKVVRKIVAKK